MQDPSTALRSGQDKERLKILILLPRLGAGGAERITIALCHRAVEQGLDVILCAADGVLRNELPDHPRFRHVDLPLHRKGIVAGFKIRKALNRLIARERPDIIHSHSRWPSWLVRRLARKYDLPFVTTAHAVHGHSNFLKRAYSGIQQQGEPWIAVSQFVADENRRIYPAAADTCEILPIGADLSRLQKDEAAEQGLRKDLAVGDNPLVLVPTRISSAYDTKTVLEAFSGINIPVTLLFNGGTKNRKSVEELENLARHLPSNIKVHIRQDDATYVASLFAADLVIVSSARPGAFGLVIAEAQAVGCPVFASAAGGAVEQIDNPDAQTIGSRLFPAGDKTALAAHMDRLLTGFDTESRSGRHNSVSVERLRQRYNLDSHLDGTLAIYERLAKNR